MASKAAVLAFALGLGLGLTLRGGFSSLRASPSSFNQRLKTNGSSQARRPSFFLLGDSITQFGSDYETGGWACRLQGDYTAKERKIDVLNRGFSGYTSRWILAGLPKLLSDLSDPNEVLLATVMLGANDACKPGHVQHVPLEEYTSNMAAIVRTLRERLPNARVVVISPPPIDNEHADPEDTAGRDPAKYAASVMKVVTDMADPMVHALDFHTEMSREADWKAMLNDGLHLGPGGNELLYQKLTALVAAECPTLLPAAIPIHLPHWSEATGFDFSEL